MSAARKSILKATAKALPAKRSDALKIAAEARRLLENPEAVRPALPLVNVVASFLQRVSGSKANASAELISSLHALPGAVARFLQAHGRPLSIVLQPAPALKALDWGAAGLTADGTLNDGVAVGLARWGIAEYGSVVFHSAADAPILYNFLPAIHIAAIHSSSIVGHFEDYAEAARQSGDPAPRNACLITGASGTTDIEGNLVLGAHGPRNLHIVVIDDEAAE